MLSHTKYGSQWITLEFTTRVNTEIKDWFKGYARDWFWNAEVRRNHEAFGYNRPRRIVGKFKTFDVNRVSYGKFVVSQIKRAN